MAKPRVEHTLRARLDCVLLCALDGVALIGEPPSGYPVCSPIDLSLYMSIYLSSRGRISLANYGKCLSYGLAYGHRVELVRLVAGLFHSEHRYGMLCLIPCKVHDETMVSIAVCTVSLCL